MKICTKCKIETPEDLMVQSGSSSWCKLCAAQYTKRFRGTERGRAYTTYNGMLARCYDSKASRYSKYGGAGVTVCDEWLGEEGFNNFFSWYKTQPNSNSSTYQLDKDILCNNKGIKPHYYSPKTCQFVSRVENQRNYSSLLINNTSGYTGVTLNKDKVTWSFRLHREHTSNINRSGFKTALEAAKARETLIISESLNFKLEYVGTTMNLSEAPEETYTHYSTSNYSMIRKVAKSGKYTGTVKLFNGTRKSIGQHSSEYLAAKSYNNMLIQLGIESINKQSLLFGFSTITKEP